jgi:cell division protease FtsH
MTGNDFDAVDFGRQLQQFLQMLDARLPARQESELVSRLAEHLEAPPDGLPVVTESYAIYDHANVQVAVDRYLERDGRHAELIGVGGGGGIREHNSFSELIDLAVHHQGFGIGAVDYVTVPVGVDREHTCVRFGVYLVTDGPARLAVLFRIKIHNGPPQVLLEVLTADPQTARRFLAEIRELVGRYNLFRGQIVSVESHEFGHGVGPVRFHTRPDVSRDDVILPSGVLDMVERQVIGVATHRERLLAAGHHLKRGVLLFGPPGSGKTHTVRYLMARLPEVTVVVVTGLGVHFIREACALARLVPPALVVVEDVDLIAEARAMHSGMDNPLLFQILNEMDGVAGDCDVAFVLTTNRADLIEPALAQRPGRIDLAAEVPLPDARARRRLLVLYGPRLALDADDVEHIVAETEGMAASFFAELSRRAELLAATESTEPAGVAAVRTALAELRASREALALASADPTAHPSPASL